MRDSSVNANPSRELASSQEVEEQGLHYSIDPSKPRCREGEGEASRGDPREFNKLTRAGYVLWMWTREDQSEETSTEEQVRGAEAQGQVHRYQTCVIVVWPRQDCDV